ncbi:restriction endonuclease subunit S [Dyella agri]|uniref:Restriction endonuclease subunit S n=1 Tax=Dyella agri TaxID=1926869 RepID=A0ABW8KLY7_9GAMM
MTKLVPVKSIFSVCYGSNLELNALKRDPDGINFVSRTARNNGVSAKVELDLNLKPIPAGCLTVAGGGSVLETFVQPEPFYSGRDLYYLVPLERMTLQEKLYYCTVIRANRYRFNYGRQANRTLKDIKIPARSEVPSWVQEVFIHEVDGWRKKLSSLKKLTKV